MSLHRRGLQYPCHKPEPLEIAPNLSRGWSNLRGNHGSAKRRKETVSWKKWSNHSWKWKSLPDPVGRWDPKFRDQKLPQIELSEEKHGLIWNTSKSVFWIWVTENNLWSVSPFLLYNSVEENTTPYPSNASDSTSVKNAKNHKKEFKQLLLARPWLATRCFLPSQCRKKRKNIMIKIKEGHGNPSWTTHAERWRAEGPRKDWQPKTVHMLQIEQKHDIQKTQSTICRKDERQKPGKQRDKQ